MKPLLLLLMLLLFATFLALRLREIEPICFRLSNLAVYIRMAGFYLAFIPAIIYHLSDSICRLISHW